ETAGERRERVERAMRLALNGEMRRLETNLPFLATLGSAAPFIGLFGTVWGIMRSFAGIAAANNTSLAVVAPGIAEALFATAMGLAAAIPAVVVPLDLPKTSAAEQVQPKEPVVLSLDREGDTFIGNERVEERDLKDRLARLAADDPGRIVYVRGDRGISYARLMDALGLVNT